MKYIYILILVSVLSNHYCAGQLPWKNYYDSAVYYKNNQLNDEAINNFNKAKDLLAKDSSVSESYYKTLKNLVDIYLPMGMNNDAAPLCFEIKLVLEKLNRKEHADYATNLDQLGRVHGSSNPGKAEQFYLQAKYLRKKIFSDSSLPYANTCNNLGGLYTETGVYDKAIAL
jgi:tetratricopeptide (TPR) repeat protein